MTFKTIRSDTVFKGRAFNVRQDDIQLPDFSVTRLDIVDHPNSIGIVPVDDQGSVWFVNQYRHPTGGNSLELPAGVMDVGETPEQTAAREIREEIGMAAGKLQKIGQFYLAPGYSTELMHIFLATELYPSPLPPDEDEYIQIEKIAIAQALQMAETGQIEDAHTVAALHLARHYLKER